MQVDVHVDYDKNQIEVVGEPVFYLVEAESIDVFDDGRTHGHMGRNFTMTKEDWKKVHENEGDFSSIGIKLNRDVVAGFDAYVASWRRPRIPISLLDE
jgi:hypothetical protein